MSPREAMLRVEEQAKRQVSRYYVPDLSRAATGDALPGLPGLAEGVAQLARETGVRADWTRLADGVSEGRLSWFGVSWPRFAETPDWHLDPVSGQHWPAQAYCFDVSYRHAGSFGDVKFVWELGRLQYLQPLAALAHASHDAALAERVLAHVASWIAANPPYRGIHWCSGIELALRCVSLLIVASLLGPAIR
ncbi:MAG: hypothetical protein FJX68_14660 [Alphaproteobacteria bacterium]|nr:hypothetical protein [Alphaproteobacteria bacterium]